MKYRVLLEGMVREQIASWELPRELLVRVLGWLSTELAEDPHAWAGEIIAPLQYRAAPFLVQVDQPIPRRHLFTFAIFIDEAEKVVRVAMARYDMDDPTNN